MNISKVYKIFGKKLAEARKKQGLTQEKLAVASSLSRSSIANIESGRQAIPLHTLLLIANALKIPAAELLPQPDEFDDGFVMDNAIVKEKIEGQSEAIQELILKTIEQVRGTDNAQ